MTLSAVFVGLLAVVFAGCARDSGGPTTESYSAAVKANSTVEVVKILRTAIDAAVAAEKYSRGQLVFALEPPRTSILSQRGLVHADIIQQLAREMESPVLARSAAVICETTPRHAGTGCHSKAGTVFIHPWFQALSDTTATVVVEYVSGERVIDLERTENGWKVVRIAIIAA